MLRFNTKIIKNKKQADIFDKMEHKYGKLKSYTPEQIKLISNLNKIDVSHKGGNVMVEYKEEELDKENEVSLVDYYYQNSLDIFCGTGAIIFIIYLVSIMFTQYYDIFDMGIGINYVLNLIKELVITFLYLNLYVSFVLFLFKKLSDLNNKKEKDNFWGNLILSVLFSFVLKK